MTPPLPDGARVLFVTVRQRRLSGSWPPWPAAAVALPGPGAPLAPGRSQAPHARSSRGASKGKTRSKRTQTQGEEGQGNGAWRAPPCPTSLGASSLPSSSAARAGHPELQHPSLRCRQVQGQGRPQRPGRSPLSAPLPKGLPTNQRPHPRRRKRGKWR